MVGSALESILSDYNIYGGLIPDSPGSEWIVYTMISNVPHNSKTGASTYDQYRFQLDCHARTPDLANTLAAAVRTLLDEYSGTVSSVTIDHIFYDGEYDASSSIAELESREDFFRRTQDYIIFVRP